MLGTGGRGGGSVGPAGGWAPDGLAPPTYSDNAQYFFLRFEFPFPPLPSLGHLPTGVAVKRNYTRYHTVQPAWVACWSWATSHQSTPSRSTVSTRTIVFSYQQAQLQQEEGRAAGGGGEWGRLSNLLPLLARGRSSTMPVPPPPPAPTSSTFFCVVLGHRWTDGRIPPAPQSPAGGAGWPTVG